MTRSFLNFYHLSQTEKDKHLVIQFVSNGGVGKISELVFLSSFVSPLANSDSNFPISFPLL